MHCPAVNRLAVLLLLSVALVAPIAAQDNLPVRLTNADVVKMVNAGIPESVIIRTIQISEPDFAVTPDALISLKRQHVPDGVLAAIVDSQGAGRSVAANAPVIQYVGGHPATAHLHQLPNIDASFKIDSKTSGKVEVRKNKIKVEKAGVPLFSVSWKDNSSK